MQTLVIGGTSGLGLEIAKLFKNRGEQVIVTGRTNPNIRGISFQKFELAMGQSLAKEISELVSVLPKIDRLVYAAGFYQEGDITELSEKDVSDMLDVGLNAPIWFVRELLRAHGKIKDFIAITSTSQWTPRLKEPIYTATKAGLGMLANSLAEDSRVGKVLVLGPAGMSTGFWRADGRTDPTYNDPSWVAKQTVDALKANFRYAFVKVLRNPARVEVVETR